VNSELVLHLFNLCSEAVFCSLLCFCFPHQIYIESQLYRITAADPSWLPRHYQSCMYDMGHGQAAIVFSPYISGPQPCSTVTLNWEHGEHQA